MNSSHEYQSKSGRTCSGELICAGTGTESGMLPLIATAGIFDSPPDVVVVPHGPAAVVVGTVVVGGVVSVVADVDVDVDVISPLPANVRTRAVTAAIVSSSSSILRRST